MAARQHSGETAGVRDDHQAKRGWSLVGLGVGMLILLLLGQLDANAQAAKQVEFDPATCKSDAKNRFWIAFGQTVLAMPTWDIIVGERFGQHGNPLDGEFKRVPPPDPSEPEGCPDNPLQVKGYASLPLGE